MHSILGNPFNLLFSSGLKPKINILDILKPAEEVEESSGLSQSDCKFTFEPHREKTGLLPMRKQRRRSASQ